MEDQTKPKARRRKERIKIGIEINKTVNKKSREKKYQWNEKKNVSLERETKLTDLLARLTKTERGFKLLSSGKRGNETFVHTKMYTQVFTAALFIITISKSHPNIHQLQNGSICHRKFI